MSPYLLAVLTCNPPLGCPCAPWAVAARRPTLPHQLAVLIRHRPTVLPACTHAIQKQLRQAHLAHQLPAPPLSTKRNGNRRHDRHAHTRSASPTQAGSSRGRYRSRSPPARENGFTPRRGETRTRNNGKRGKGDQGQFFRSGADSRGGVCATCLGRHEHTFGKCEARKLWNGAAAGARKVGIGRLVGEDGLPICYDWQLPPGCQSTLHNERHKCSGCGKSSHGAQNCPRAEKE